MLRLISLLGLVALQFLFALFILKTPIGITIFSGAQTVVDQLNVYANEGATMIASLLACYLFTCVVGILL